MPETKDTTGAETRRNYFDYDVTKFMTDLRFRPLDFEALVALGRRNIEALTQANQFAIEAVQAVARRQMEMTRQTLDDASALWRDLVQPATNEERLAKHTEYAKQVLEKSLAHGREITTLATKAGNDAADVLYKRAREGLDELREFARSAAAR
jgi:phasin family protein